MVPKIGNHFFLKDFIPTKNFYVKVKKIIMLLWPYHKMFN